MLRQLRDRLRSWVYDWLIVSFTAKWYEAVLARHPDNAILLDVGIGTGAALVRNERLLRSKQIRVFGVDYDMSYCSACERNIRSAKLEEYVHVTCKSIYDYSAGEVDGGRPFDAVYFSGSFMILPDKAGAVRHVVGLLKSQGAGRIYFTQTFEERRNRLLEWVKPRLSYWTSIDFGGVTYEPSFNEVLASSGLEIVHRSTINDGKARRGVRHSALIEARATLTSPN